MSRRLFFICPTDCIETKIRGEFSGKVFFCSALGLYFKLDFQMQKNLKDLISENCIDQVIFVSDLNNTFYKQTLDETKKLRYTTNGLLSKSREKEPYQPIAQNVFFPNLHSLAANHVQEQKKRLLSSDFLGKYLISENIEVKGYIYQSSKDDYFSLEEIENLGHLFNSIASN